MKIKIVKDGPYIVSGGVPLHEKLIVPKGNGYILKEGRALPQGQMYALCRCGQSKNMPFCDGEHAHGHFSGAQTADTESFINRAAKISGPKADLLDDGRCAYARFCHREDGDIWELIESNDDRLIEEAVIAANECPAGRLVVIDKDGKWLEWEEKPAIEILSDLEMASGGAMTVKGRIPLIGEDGTEYEVRNRMTLCRCGNSANKPFCDAAHITEGFGNEKKDTACQEDDGK